VAHPSHAARLLSLSAAIEECVHDGDVVAMEGFTHLIPYVAAEPFYESQYGKWSTTDLYVGSLFPVGKVVQFDLYYEHENNTGKHPNKQNNFVGVVLYLYFSREKSSAP